MPAVLRDRQVEHLLRRAAFGASPAELTFYSSMSLPQAVDYLVNYEDILDRVDDQIGKAGYVGVTARGQFSPSTNINDARQRWLFRMVHSERPLQEKMTLFWHNHFATAYSKVAGALGGTEGVRVMAAKPSEDPGKVKGQIELLREHALGNFRDLLVEVSKDVAMLVWLDGRLNVRNKPQENFAREIMELFTMGVGFYTEADVYAGARVFTGWNMRLVGARGDPMTHYEFFYNANQHETSAKTFSFPIYPDGGRTIPARSAASGMQDGIDLIDAVARHPETGRRLARKLYRFFVSELDEPGSEFIDGVADIYYRSGYNMRAVLRRVLLSPEFNAPSSPFARYAWPVEFVVRAIKEVGWRGFSVNETLTPLVNMGQQLFEPPDVAGWELGQGWFSSGSMLARMNFASALASNQKFNLRESSRSAGRTPESLLSHFLTVLSPADFDDRAREALLAYLRAGGSWTGSDAQLLTKAAGLVHLICGSSEYQFV